MEWKEFFKKCTIDFLLIQSGITLAIGIIGCIIPSPEGISPYVFFMPFVYAFFCILPSFVVYSPKELDIRQIIVRKIIQFVLTEAVVLLISCIAGSLNDAFTLIAIASAAAVIFVGVNLLECLISKISADQMTQKILLIKKREQEAKLHE